MRTFIFIINYGHWRTGKIVETKVAVIKAANLKEAKNNVWDNYGADNASIPYEPMDITDQASSSFSIYAHNFQ